MDTPKIYESIIGVMEDIGVIGKDSRNQTQGFMYRGIDAVMNALQPALIKRRVFIVPEVIDDRSEERQSSRGGTLIYRILTVKYHFISGIDGSEVTSTVIGEGMDSGDKASNKALSIAYKYACFQVFCIPTEEMTDPDSESHEVAPKEQPKPPIEIPETVQTEAPRRQTHVSETQTPGRQAHASEIKTTGRQTHASEIQTTGRQTYASEIKTPGTYKVTIDGLKMSHSRNGNEMLVAEFTVSEGPQAGQRIKPMMHVTNSRERIKAAEDFVRSLDTEITRNALAQRLNDAYLAAVQQQTVGRTYTLELGLTNSGWNTYKITA